MAQRLLLSVPWGGGSGSVSGLRVGVREEGEELWHGLLLRTDVDEGMFSSNPFVWPQLCPPSSAASDGAVERG